VGEWVRRLEEKSLDEGYGGQKRKELMDEERRVQLVGYEMRVDEKWASVRVRQKDGVEKEGIVRW
jgi:hypothetical protein